MPSIARWIGVVVVLGGSAAWAEEPAQVVPAAFGRERPPDGPAPAAAAPAKPAEPAAPLPLGSASRGRSEHGKSPGGLPALVTVAGSLAVVLGLFLAGAWAMRRAAPRGSILLPSEVFEVLGRAPLAGRQQVHLLRCGRKLLLVCVTPAGTETLTEVTEPGEVDRLAGACRQAHPHGATAAFRQVFQQWAPRSPHPPSHDEREFAEVGAGQGTRQNGLRREDDDA
jgi:flagellar biogenesis protein FliO